MRRIVILMAGAALLGGCQALFGETARLDVRPLGGDVSAEIAAASLEEGRTRLREGQVGYAIVSLRQAATNPAYAAEAHNALGVAYARLGRGDLAERYFREAMAESPQDPRYAANLARYYQSRDAALARAPATPLDQFVPAAAPSVAVVPSTPQPKHVSGAAAAEMIQRVSAREVVVRTASAPASTGITVGARPQPPRMAVAATGQQPVAARPVAARTGPRVTAARTSSGNGNSQSPLAAAGQTYPIRITLEATSRHSRSVAGPTVRTAPAVVVARSTGRAYPIRIPITGTVASR